MAQTTQVAQPPRNSDTTPTYASDLLSHIFDQFSEPEPVLCTVIRNNQFIQVPETELTEAERRSAYNCLFSPCTGGW